MAVRNFPPVKRKKHVLRVKPRMGHAELSTTVYTQVSIQKLKDIHTATHPAKLHTGESEEKDNTEAMHAPRDGEDGNA